MWSALGALLGAGLMSGGSILGSSIGASSSDYAAAKSYDAAMKTNELNYQMFKENQSWLERMANSAHQREVQDLRAAGLNPILSATGGSGAAVPSLASPSMVSPGSPVADKAALFQGMVSDIIKSVSTASGVAEKWAKTEKAIAETKQTEKITDKEVGKRHLPAYLHDQITSNAGNLSNAGRQVMGILSDLTRAASNNFKVFKQTLFNNFRQEERFQQQINLTPYNTAPRSGLE